VLAFGSSESTATLWRPTYLEVQGPMGARAKPHQCRRSSEGTHMDNRTGATLEISGANPDRPHVRTCKIDGCDGATGVPGTARGWCMKHYRRWSLHGDPYGNARCVCAASTAAKMSGGHVNGARFIIRGGNVTVIRSTQ
jgi:hypothetical protein